MNIMELGAIGELVGGVAVIGSLIYLGLQVRQSNRLTRAETAQAFVHAYNRDVLSPLQDPAVAKTFRRGMNDFESLNQEEQIAFHVQFTKIFFLGHTDFILRRHGLIEEDIAAAMQGYDVAIFKSPGAAQWWNRMRGTPPSDYVAHLDRLLKEYEGPAFTELAPWWGPDEPAGKDA